MTKRANRGGTHPVLVAPAVRLVVVEAWARVETDDGKEQAGEVLATALVYPVVALCYVGGVGGEDAAIDPLVLVPGADGTGEVVVWCKGDRPAALVACPWPPEDDPRRLKDVVGRLKAEAVAAVRRAMPAPVVEGAGGAAPVQDGGAA